MLNPKERREIEKLVAGIFLAIEAGADKDAAVAMLGGGLQSIQSRFYNTGHSRLPMSAGAQADG